jgi:MerR family transcriptional regulator, light-induced transcriptional regulator
MLHNCEVSLTHPTDIEPVDGELSVTVAVAARRLGIAPATLRTWDRRYGVGPSQRDDGKNRRYSPSDLARLDYMTALIRSGHSPAASAAATLGRDLAEFKPDLSKGEPTGSRIGRSGGGNVVATPGCDRRARGLAKATSALDQAACALIINESLKDIGVVPTWNEILLPILKSIGEMWELRQCGIEVEHILSTAIQSEFSRFAYETKTKTSRATVVLGSMSGDSHQLPVWAVGAGLAERGIRFVHLGSGMPLESLGDVIARTGPRAVFLWSQIKDASNCDDLAQLPSLRPNPRIVIGGPGWVNEPPRGVHVANDLKTAVALISEVVSD